MILEKNIYHDLSRHLRRLLATLAFLLMLVSISQSQTARKPGQADNATLQVYPNPSSGKFNVLVKEQEQSFHINIYSIIGEMVFHWESGNANTANFEVDLSRRPDGIYFVELDTEKANTVKRLVLERH